MVRIKTKSRCCKNIYYDEKTSVTSKETDIGSNILTISLVYHTNKGGPNLWHSVFDVNHSEKLLALCFVVSYFISILVLQSS